MRDAITNLHAKIALYVMLSVRVKVNPDGMIARTIAAHDEYRCLFTHVPSTRAATTYSNAPTNGILADCRHACGEDGHQLRLANGSHQ